MGNRVHPHLRVVPPRVSRRSRVPALWPVFALGFMFQALVYAFNEGRDHFIKWRVLR